MTTYKGEKLSPRIASEKEQDLITEYFVLKNEVKEKYQRMDDILELLPKKTPLVSQVLESPGDEGYEDAVTKTLIVDKPSGQHVTYKELAFCMNAKTTKSDLKEVSN